MPFERMRVGINFGQRQPHADARPEGECRHEAEDARRRQPAVPRVRHRRQQGVLDAQRRVLRGRKICERMRKAGDDTVLPARSCRGSGLSELPRPDHRSAPPGSPSGSRRRRRSRPATRAGPPARCRPASAVRWRRRTAPLLPPRPPSPPARARPDQSAAPRCGEKAGPPASAPHRCRPLPSVSKELAAEAVDECHPRDRHEEVDRRQDQVTAVRLHVALRDPPAGGCSCCSR